MVQPSPSWQTVRVYGTWRRAADGPLREGAWTAIIPERLTVPADDSIFPAGVFKTGRLVTDTSDTAPADGYLDGPSLDELFPATDDPNVLGDPWFLNLEITFDDGAAAETYVFPVSLADAANGINLLRIAPQETISGGADARGVGDQFPLIDGGTP